MSIPSMPFLRRPLSSAPAWAGRVPWMTLAILLCGTVPGLFGAAALFQWLTHGTSWLHVGPGQAIFHFNSALCFLMEGLGLVCLVFRRPGWAALCSGGVLAISLATAAEYLFHVDFGIDQLVVHAYVTSNPTHPGRMSPITSLNAFLFGLLLLVQSRARAGGWRFSATCLLSSFILANNGMALVGYVLGLPESYTWGLFHRVTLQTGFGFVLLAVAFILFALRRIPPGERLSARGIPLAAGLGVFTSSLILWQVLLAGNRWQIVTEMDAIRNSLSAQMTEQIDSRVRALERMGRRIETRPSMTFPEWRADAALYIEHEQVFRGIARTDASGKVIWWINDDLGLQPPPDRMLGGSPLQREAMRQATVAGGGSTVASPHDRIGAGEATFDGFTTWTPIYARPGQGGGPRLDGFVTGLFDIRQLLSRIDSANGLGKFSFRVREGKGDETQVLYQRGPFGKPGYRQTFPLAYPGLDWEIDVEPGPLLLARENAHLCHLILAVGLLFAWTLAWALTEYQRARRRMETLQSIEATLRESEERYRLLVSNVQDYAIYPLGPDGKIVGWNPGAARLSGYKGEEVIGRSPLSFYPPEEVEAGIPSRLLTLAETEGRSLHEGWRLRKDGSRYWAQATLTSLRNGEGVLIGFSTLIRDLTRQKDSEDRQKKSEDLLARRNRDLEEAMRRVEEVSRLKSEFLSNMSHELRTPLNSIIGFSEFLYDGKPGSLNATQQEYLDDVLKSARYLLQLINDLLDLAKIEAGKMELRLESFSLRDVAGEVLGLFRQEIERKALALASRLDVGDVVLDPKMIRQILNNLLSNAVKFTPNGGRIDLALAPVQDGADWIAIVVRDSGIGIKPEDFELLFGEFQQLDSGASRRYQGSGLGLALTRKLVLLHGGEIRVESVFSEGSTFTVLLPRRALPTPSS